MYDAGSLMHGFLYGGVRLFKERELKTENVQIGSFISSHGAAVVRESHAERRGGGGFNPGLLRSLSFSLLPLRTEPGGRVTWAPRDRRSLLRNGTLRDAHATPRRCAGQRDIHLSQGWGAGGGDGVVETRVKERGGGGGGAHFDSLLMQRRSYLQGL